MEQGCLWIHLKWSSSSYRLSYNKTHTHTQKKRKTNPNWIKSNALRIFFFFFSEFDKNSTRLDGRWLTKTFFFFNSERERDVRYIYWHITLPSSVVVVVVCRRQSTDEALSLSTPGTTHKKTTIESNFFFRFFFAVPCSCWDGADGFRVEDEEKKRTVKYKRKNSNRREREIIHHL